jgi:hypothetical protein
LSRQVGPLGIAHFDEPSHSSGEQQSFVVAQIVPMGRHCAAGSRQVWAPIVPPHSPVQQSVGASHVVPTAPHWPGSTQLTLLHAPEQQSDGTLQDAVSAVHAAWTQICAPAAPWQFPEQHWPGAVQAVPSWPSVQEGGGVGSLDLLHASAIAPARSSAGMADMERLGVRMRILPRAGDAPARAFASFP